MGVSTESSGIGRLNIILLIFIIVSAAGCSTVKHVPDGEYLLDNVQIRIEEDGGEVKSSELVNYLRQTPNHKVMGFAKLQLSTYSLSGRDSTKWYNKWLRRLGQPPVIYDSTLTAASARQLRQALINRGYMNAAVTVDTTGNSSKKKMNVIYKVVPGPLYTIENVAYEIPDSSIRKIVMADSATFVVKTGSGFNRNNLDSERTRITERLRNSGYYGFTKEYITFFADTAENSTEVDLTMVIKTPGQLSAQNSGDSNIATDSLPADSHKIYMIRDVFFITDAESEGMMTEEKRDTVEYKDIHVVYGKDHFLKPGILEEKCFIQPGQKFSTRAVDRTYESLAQLGILKSINIELVPVAAIGDNEWLDVNIFLTRNKKQGVTFELEGTNSEGDLGFGVGLTYQHRDFANSSNLFTAKLRANYESLSGNLSGLINNSYTELAAETGITFPKFMFPFVSRSFKQRIKATTELLLSFNYQERPEYTRIIAGAGWRYKWTARSGRERRAFDLVDINYVYLPKSTLDFLDQIAPSNPLLRYSYEDHFIMRAGYSFSRTNRRILSATSARNQPFQKTIFSVRAAGETAGNVLYALSSILGQKRDDGVYKVFGIQYAQYVKAEGAYSIVRNFDRKHSVAFNAAGGIGVPYGNSRVLPFEKRFYGGGANGVRGWGVRTLGPGAYESNNSVTDFINQCGDIMLLLNFEYRIKLFWVFEGSLFIDAGNIWTIHNYENQPGGMFRFSTFWKQLAASYGAGVRMDFTYFLLRFDLGMKAHNPAMNRDHWPIIHPRWKRDAAFHFSVGYPF
ncbi:MAG: BamA/TamA family outer membrane protein [Paramuribaculum sp.]|nr:BamA/TamA family outer membrane protein [Paramuribaculum sp.]